MNLYGKPKSYKEFDDEFLRQWTLVHRLECYVDDIIESMSEYFGINEAEFREHILYTFCNDTWRERRREKME